MLTSTSRFGLGVAFTLAAAFGFGVSTGSAVGIVCDEPGTIIRAIKLRKISAFSPAFFSCRRLLSRIVATSLLTCASTSGNPTAVHISLKRKDLQSRCFTRTCADQHAVSPWPQTLAMLV